MGEVSAALSIMASTPQAVELSMQRAVAGAGPGRAVGTGVDRSSALYQACQDFEALFIKQMLAAMRKTVSRSGLLDGGIAQEVFEDFLYDEYAKSMARTAGFGLADTVYLHLTSAQAAALAFSG